MPTAAVVGDLEPMMDVLNHDAEIMVLRGELLLFDLFVHISFIYLLAQLTAARQELKARNKAAGGSDKEHVLIKRPKNVKNLQAAMKLSDQKYHDFRVSLFLILLSM